MSERHELVVDRIEGDRCVVEIDGAAFVDIPRWLLPFAARPDDVIVISVERDAERAVVTLQRDPAATERARAAARDAIERLKRRDPGGDVQL